ncbi:hypothetical protein ACFX1X_019159 [Malus domestica]
MHEVLEGSDHAMLILGTNVAPLSRRWRFIYDARWNKVDECHDIVATSWRRGVMGSYAFWVVEKLKGVRYGLQNWRRLKGCNSKACIDALKRELRLAYKSPIFASDDIRRKEGELKRMIKEEEAYWKQKSQVQWIREGDKKY